MAQASKERMDRHWAEVNNLILKATENPTYSRKEKEYWRGYWKRWGDDYAAALREETDDFGNPLK